MKNIEIERKFLITDLYSVLKMASKSKSYINDDICQVYIGDNVRVKRKVRRYPEEEKPCYCLTVKTDCDGIERKEFEFEISEQSGKELIDEFSGRSVVKSRHIFEYKGKIWEIDSFMGDNDGLAIAEVELKDSDESIEIPPGIGVEVSNDSRYYNSFLSENPYKKWRQNSGRD